MKRVLTALILIPFVLALVFIGPRSFRSTLLRRIGMGWLRLVLRVIARVRVTSEARAKLMVDVVARISAATGELLEARGTLITWQPAKRNATVVLQRR